MHPVLKVSHCLTRPRLSHSFGSLGAAKAFVIMILFAMGSICYPLAVSLATREVPPELQGSLTGSCYLVCFSCGFQGFRNFFIFCGFLLIFFKLVVFLFHIVRWWPKIQVSVLETLAKIFAPVLASDEPWWQLETCSFRVHCIF